MEFSIKCEHDFSLQKTIAGKPRFFFFDDKPSRFVCIGEKIVKISLSQDETKIVVTYDKALTDDEVDLLQKRLEFCLGLRENMEPFYFVIHNDPVLHTVYQQIYGSRLVSAYDDFEAVICILYQQTMTYEQYRKSIKRLIETVGKGVFPSPHDILARKSALKQIAPEKEQTIIDIAEFFARNGKVTPEMLYQLPGFGQQSIDMFFLFQKRDYSHFYVEGMIKRIFRDKYGVAFIKDVEYKNFAKKMFNEYAGLAEVYLRQLIVEEMAQNA